MGCKHILTGLLITFSIYLLLINQYSYVMGAPRTLTNLDTQHRTRGRPAVRLAARPSNQYTRMKPDNDFFVDEDDLFELSKRQASDDYGHLRFGKRDEEQFDDYGHMRFGRSGVESK